MKLTLALAALAFTSLSAIAQAQSADVVKIEVSYADLNLSNAAGASTMLARIRAAATQACGGRPAMHDLRTASAYRSCVRTAVRNAVADLNAAQVSALYTARTGDDLRNSRETSITQR